MGTTAPTISSTLFSSGRTAGEKYPLFCWANFIGLFPWLYFLPTLVIDVFILCVLIRTFKTPFYKLLTYSLIWDSISWLTDYISFRGNKTPVYFSIYDSIPAFGWVPTSIIYINYYSFYVHWFLSYMLTVNRFLFCLTPENYERICKGVFPYIIFFAHAYPLMCTWHLIYYGGYCEKQPGYYRIDKIDTVDSVKSSFSRSSFYQLIVSVVYGITSIPMNIYILTKLWMRRIQRHKMILNSERQSMDAEAKLFVFTAVLFLFAGMSIACQAIFYFKSHSLSDEDANFFISIQLYAQDLYVCTAPWLLFLLNGSIRKEIKRLYTVQKPTVHVTTNICNTSKIIK